MSYLSFVPYNGEVWSYVFVNPDIFGVSNQDRSHLVWNMIDLHKKHEDSRDVKGEDYEGRITKEKSAVMGSLCGALFGAELDTPKGKRKPKIMLLDKVDASLN